MKLTYSHREADKVTQPDWYLCTNPDDTDST